MASNDYNNFLKEFKGSLVEIKMNGGFSYIGTLEGFDRFDYDPDENHKPLLLRLRRYDGEPTLVNWSNVCGIESSSYTI